MGWPVHPGMISLAYAMPPVTASTRPAVDTPMPSTCSRRERASASTVFATSHTVTSTGPPHAAPAWAPGFRTRLQGQRRSARIAAARRRSSCRRYQAPQRMRDIPCTPPFPFRKAPYHLVSTMVPQTKKPARVEPAPACKSEEKLLADGSVRVHEAGLLDDLDDGRDVLALERLDGARASGSC